MHLASLTRILEQTCGLDRSRPVVAGVSGGPDSLTLLDILHCNGYRVIVAHFNHHLRDEAGEDADAVRRAADAYGVEFVLGEGDVRSLVKEEKLTVEEAARKARYRFLFATARERGAQAVAVGHTADDQVETMLMHLLRGSGLAGLRGMPWRGTLPEFDADLPLVRPLLGMWREEVLSYCQEHDLRPVMDASNADTTFFRNRLRLELVPYLQGYNPRIKEVLWRMGQTLQGDYETIEAGWRGAAAELRIEEGRGFIHWERTGFLRMPIGIRRNLIRDVVFRLRENERDLDFETVERALDFIEHPSRSGGIELALGLNLMVEGERVYLREQNVELTDPTWPRLESEEAPMHLPGKLDLADGWALLAEVRDWTEDLIAEVRGEDNLTSWLDFDKLGAELLVRRARPGDRFQPYGLDGHSLKVSDIWVNIKLPRPARAAWPLVCSGETIAWMPGYRPGQAYAIDAGTRRVVRLEMRKPD